MDSDPLDRQTASPFSTPAVTPPPGPAASTGRRRPDADRARVRIGVAAAVVLLLGALGTAVAVTAVGQVGHRVEVPANLSTTGAPPADAAGGVPGSATSSAAASQGLFVHVLGAVARPGLYEVSESARVVDVVAAAGGLLPAADQAGLNLARPVSDGEQLYVPAKGEVLPGAPPGTLARAPNDAATGGVAAKVNLNTATVADLDALPRIGPTMAQRIVDYRTNEGRFSSIDDLRNVTGIGEKTFDALKDLITV